MHDFYIIFLADPLGNFNSRSKLVNATILLVLATFVSCQHHGTQDLEIASPYFFVFILP